MGTLSELEKLNEIRIHTADLVLDPRHKVTLNVKLVSFDCWQETVEQLSASPVELLPELFLDPNTGEKVFTSAQAAKFSKFLIEKLIELFIKVNLGSPLSGGDA